MGGLRRLLPSNADDIVGTLSRILRTRDPPAWAEVRVAERTRGAIGPARFWMVSYERSCADPNALLERLSHEVLGQPFTPLTDAERESIQVSTHRVLDETLFARIVAACEEMGLSRDTGSYYL